MHLLCVLSIKSFGRIQVWLSRFHSAQAKESHAKSAKDAKDAKHPLRTTTRQTVSQRFVTECLFLRGLRDLCVRFVLHRYGLAPRFPQEANEIPVRDHPHILFRITPRL